MVVGCILNNLKLMKQIILNTNININININQNFKNPTSLSPPYGILYDYPPSIDYMVVFLLIFSWLLLGFIVYLVFRLIKSSKSHKKISNIGFGIDYKKCIEKIDNVKKLNYSLFEDKNKNKDKDSVDFFNTADNAKEFSNNIYQLKNSIRLLISYYTNSEFSSLDKKERLNFYNLYKNKFSKDFQDSLEHFFDKIDIYLYKKIENRNVFNDYDELVKKSYLLAKQIHNAFYKL